MVHETFCRLNQNIGDLEKLFLTHFFEDDSEISVLILLAAKKKGYSGKRKSNHLQGPSQSEEVWLPVNHMEINCTPLRMST